MNGDLSIPGWPLVAAGFLLSALGAIFILRQPDLARGIDRLLGAPAERPRAVGSRRWAVAVYGLASAMILLGLALVLLAALGQAVP